MLESKIEKDCTKWAIKQGWLSYKFVSPANRGMPDRLYLRAGKTVFVEFKTASGKLSALQSRQIEKLKANDFKVFIIRNLEGFKIAFT
tara:strand:+ start:238 stop:501 length:264 start_codon:yes stop_codon:yes gene_type:complete